MRALPSLTVDSPFVLFRFLRCETHRYILSAELGRVLCYLSTATALCFHMNEMWIFGLIISVFRDFLCFSILFTN